jgi:hypothetical protein
VNGLGKVDLLAYVRAIPLLVRNPQIALAPLLAALAQVLLFMIVPMDGGFFGQANQGLAQIVAQLIASFGLAVAIIAADDAWRRGRAPFDDAYEQARRKAGDIIVAAIGYSFILSIAGLVGGFLGPVFALVLTAAVTVLCIYMLPAAAIGGIPGGATLQVSAERVRNAPLSAILVAVFYFLTIAVVPTLVIAALEPLRFSTSIFSSGPVSSIAAAIVKSIAWAYVALVLSKAYNDASYGRFPRARY